MKKIKDFIIRYYPQIILVIVLSIISIVSIRWGQHLISNDNYSPELNPSVTIERSLGSPAWRSYRALGFASESEQADVFRAMSFSVFETVLPTWALGQLFYILVLWVGSFSIGFIVQKLLKNSKLVQYNKIGFLLSSVIYLTTLWTMWLYYQSMAPYISNYGFLPLLLLSFMFYLERKDNLSTFLLFVTSIVFTSTCVIATLFVVDFPFIVLFLIFLLLGRKRPFITVVKDLFKPLVIFLLTQLFWILPFVYYTYSNSGDIIDSYVNRTITSSIIDLETESQSTVNTLRFYNRTMFESYDDAPLFPRSEDFQNYDFYKALGLLPSFFALVSTVFFIFKKQWRYLILSGVFLAAVFVMKVLNPPGGEIFLWMQEYIPLFKQVFRWPFSKLGEVLIIVMVILSTYGIIYFVQFLMDFFKKSIWRTIATVSLFIIFILLQVIYAEYMFEGEIFPNRAIVQLPESYNKLGEYLEENNLEGRIYYAPPANNNYFREYDWGFWGSQFISYIIPNPMMDMSSSVGSAVGERAMWESLQVFKSGDSKAWDEYLQKYDIEYVLVDYSLVPTGYTYDIDWEIVKSLVSDYEQIWSDSELSLYSVKQQSEIVSESLQSSGLDVSGYFYRDDRGDLSIPFDGIKVSNASFKDGSLKGDFIYTGNSGYYNSNYSDIDYKKLPTKISLSRDILKLEPALPQFSNSEVILPYKSFDFSYDYLVIGDHVFDKTALLEGVAIKEEFGNEVLLYGLYNNDFKKKNLLDLFKNSQGHDCGSDGITENISISSDGANIVLEGAAELPCMYVNPRVASPADYIMKVSVNWETLENTFPGYCFLVGDSNRCLNKEKFFDSTQLQGQNEILINKKISMFDDISLILYSMNASSNFSTKTEFNKVEISYATLLNPLKSKFQNTEFKSKEVYFDNGSTYILTLPVILGDSSYVYDFNSKSGLLWQPSRPDSGAEKFSLFEDNGQVQIVQEDYINQTVNLFKTDYSSKYLLYWKGENVSNTPASLCLIYEGQDKCWYQDMFYDQKDTSNISYFRSSLKENSQLDLLYGSSSYTLSTENRLEQLVVMKYPEVWNGLGYNISKKDDYEVVQADRIFDTISSTFYKLENIPIQDHLLLSIPQSVSDGWIALGRDGARLSPLSDLYRVTINGWKQGWDISSMNYDSYVVIYWPNLLAYFGYLVIIVQGAYLTLKLFEKRSKYVKK